MHNPCCACWLPDEKPVRIAVEKEDDNEQYDKNADKVDKGGNYYNMCVMSLMRSPRLQAIL